MKCEEVQGKLSAFVDDQLSSAERTVIESHLRDCKNCAEQVRALAEVVGFLDRWQVEPEPVELRAAVLSRIASGKRSSAPPRSWSLFAYAAALLLGIAIGVLILALTGAEPPDEEAAELQEEYLSNMQLDTFDELPEGTLGEAYTALVSSDR